MGRPNIQLYHAKKPSSAAASATTRTTEYCAPTVGLEDQVFTFAKVKDATKFEVVKEELVKHFGTQTCNNGDDAARAFETSNDLVCIDPTEPPLPPQFVKNANTYGTIKYEEDPEYEINSQ